MERREGRKGGDEGRRGREEREGERVKRGGQGGGEGREGKMERGGRGEKSSSLVHCMWLYPSLHSGFLSDCFFLDGFEMTFILLDRKVPLSLPSPKNI